VCWLCVQVVQIDFPWKDAAEPWKVPKANSNYHRNLMDKGFRTSLKPLNIDQPEGPSFTVRTPEIPPSCHLWLPAGSGCDLPA
jgi:Cu2+-containing amine oxidase